MEATRVEANLLRILSERGGALLIGGNVPDASWDRLIANSYVTATARGEDSVLYELTDAGRAFLESLP